MAVRKSTTSKPRKAKAAAKKGPSTRAKPEVVPVFSGFSHGTFKFLRELDANNHKPWFDAHRADYDDHYIAPAKALVSALGPRLQKLSKEIEYEPRVNRSIFRVNRDVRFSKDKTPYKPHIDLWFWHGERGGWNSPGVWFRLRPTEVILGVGMHAFDKPQLDRFREAVLDNKRGAALDKIGQTLTKQGYVLGGRDRKTVPRGYDPDHPRAHWLLHNGLDFSYQGKVPAEARKAAFVGWCAAHAKRLWPLNDWLMQVMKTGR